jgi:hypothetical protein
VRDGKKEMLVGQAPDLEAAQDAGGGCGTGEVPQGGETPPTCGRRRHGVNVVRGAVFVRAAQPGSASTGVSAPPVRWVQLRARERLLLAALANYRQRHGRGCGCDCCRAAAALAEGRWG